MIRTLALICAILLAGWAQAQDEPVLVDWKKPIERDGITIKVVSTVRGKIKFKELGRGKIEFVDIDGVAITIEVTNTDKNKKNDGLGFDSLTTLKKVMLVDNFKNKYYATSNGPTSFPVGHQLIGSSGLYPDKTRTEVLVFQPPIETAKSLTLNLVGYAYEGKGKDQIITIPIEEFKETK